VHDLILRLPEGYDTVIGATGGKLSGGQRQRIVMAMAIMHKPAMLTPEFLPHAFRWIPDQAMNTWKI